MSITDENLLFLHLTNIEGNNNVTHKSNHIFESSSTNITLDSAKKITFFFFLSVSKFNIIKNLNYFYYLFI